LAAPCKTGPTCSGETTNSDSSSLVDSVAPHRGVSSALHTFTEVFLSIFVLCNSVPLLVVEILISKLHPVHPSLISSFLIEFSEVSLSISIPPPRFLAQERN